MDHTPRKRGRPPKHPKPLGGPLSPSALAPQTARSVGNSSPSSDTNPHNAIVGFEGSDDVEMLDRAPMVRTGQRGRPQKRGVPLKKTPGQGGGSGGLADREYPIAKDVEGGSLEVEDKTARRAKKPVVPKLHLASDSSWHTNYDAENGLDDVKDAPFMDAVVKVFCVHTEPNFSLPWQRKRQFSSNSSGFIISDRRVLTNAHSVEHHTQVKVKKRGSDTKYLATVLAIGTECDIAMLTVSNDEFWEDVTPVMFGSLPRLQDAVTVVGYPIGGDTISVTSGVVSRIEVTSYVHGATELLGVQIDAAINAGNSGGPAFNDRGQCVGIAFQSLKHEDAENIGYVIPTPVITHFITDYERTGDYTGFPILGIEWQKMENPDLRKALGMKPNQKGVRIRRVEPTAPAAKQLQSSDILLSFDNVDIANDGTVPFRHGERIGFSYLVSQKYTGESAHLKILRGSKIKEFDIELANQNRLVPAHIKGKPPSYYIIAGIVFAAVSVPYLRSEWFRCFRKHKLDALKRLEKTWKDSPEEAKYGKLYIASQLFCHDREFRSLRVIYYCWKFGCAIWTYKKESGFWYRYGKDYDYDSPVKLLDKLLHSMAQTEEEQLVVVSQVLVSDINIGYEDIVNTQILAFNGTPVRNLKHLAKMVENCEEQFLRFDLEYQQIVVLETKTAKAATIDILATHCIPSAVSDDLKV